MTWRWVALAVFLGGCSGQFNAYSAGNGPAGSPNPPGPGTPGMGGGGGSPGGAPAPTPAPMIPTTPAPPPDAGECGRLLPVSALSFQNLPAAPGARLRVRAELSSGAAPTVPWSWLVTYGEGVGTEVSVTPLDAQATVVELPLEKAGHYSLSAFTQSGEIRCQPMALAFAIPTDRQLAQFRLRLAPPAASVFPTQDTEVQVQAGMPLSQPLVLLRGAEVILEPHDASGRGGVSSYVRVTETRSGLTVEGHTDMLPFKALLLAPFTYDVLLVPDGDMAPVLHAGKTPAALNVLPLQLTPGTALAGKVADSAGQPVRDARVVLRVGALTSTVGPSDATGAFSLRARPGGFGVAVVPPPDSGLPELFLAPQGGVTIPDAATAGTADIKWAAVASAPVSLAVTGPDGLRPAAGVRARLERDAPLPAAGTLVLRPASGAPVMRALEGHAHAAGQADATGMVTLPPLPTGRYRVTLIPADGDDGAALTSTTLDLGAGGAAAVPLRLVNKVRLHGTLLPAATAAGTRVYAAPRAVDPPRPVAMALADAGGAYQLSVDPGREYVVWADPPAGRALARALLASVSAGASGAEVPTRTLPRALSFTGVVSGDRTQGGLPAVVLQAFCDPASPACLDPTLPLAETVSAASGEFTLALPDPGSL